MVSVVCNRLLRACFTGLYLYVTVIYGGYSDGDHLFPFRTEPLSPSAPMILPTRRESRSPPVFIEKALLVRNDWKSFSFCASLDECALDECAGIADCCAHRLVSRAFSSEDVVITS